MKINNKKIYSIKEMYMNFFYNNKEVLVSKTRLEANVDIDIIQAALTEHYITEVRINGIIHYKATTKFISQYG